MSEQAFLDGSFTAPKERRERLTGMLLEQVERDAAVRVLDLGCGNGLQLLDLARALPRAILVGIDSSTTNIESARSRVAASAHTTRIALTAGDYLSFESEPYDVILADSVLQNIAAPDERLYAKLARDVRPGGLIIASMPYACLFNRILWCARRGLRLFRGPAAQRVALGIATRLHPQWDRALLEERIPYLYMLPERIDDAGFVGSLARLGLERVGVELLPHASLAQPKHRLSVYRKRRSP